MMNREEKANSIGQLRDRFGRATVTLVAANRGLTVAESRALRRRLREVGGELKIAKHTLARMAIRDTPYANCHSLLRGPRGLVFGYADPVAVAKILVAFADQHRSLQIDGGAVEGQVIEAHQVKSLAMMPALPVLQMRLARQALSPGRYLMSTIRSSASRIAGAIDNRIAQLRDVDRAA